MNTAQLTPRALDVIADSGETGDPPLRNAAPGSSGGGSAELLKDIRWRINDVRDMLMSSFGDNRIYGCDEWSTPTVNLQRAIDKIDRAIAAAGERA